MAGSLEELKDDTAGCLALTLLLDQCPRNLFRHTAQAYAADARALDAARHALAEGYDANVSPGTGSFSICLSSTVKSDGPGPQR